MPVMRTVVAAAARMLDPVERLVVLGDLAGLTSPDGRLSGMCWALLLDARRSCGRAGGHGPSL